MNAAERVSRATPWWFWVFAVLFFLVQLVGISQLSVYLSSEAELEAGLTPTALTIMRAEPWWATAGYNLAMVSGFLGAVCLLGRRIRGFVGVLLAIAIAALLTQRAWFIFLSDLTHLVPPLMPYSLVILPVGTQVAAIWMARRAIRLTPQHDLPYQKST